MTPTRWAALAVVLLAAAFALMGGEYSTRDWMRLRAEVAREESLVTRLADAVDSLEREAHALETDPRVQERVARETFGMIREGEFLYKLVPE